MKPYQLLIATTVAAAHVPKKAFAAEKMTGKPLVLHYEVTGPLPEKRRGASVLSRTERPIRSQRSSDDLYDAAIEFCKELEIRIPIR